MFFTEKGGGRKEGEKGGGERRGEKGGGRGRKARFLFDFNFIREEI